MSGINDGSIIFDSNSSNSKLASGAQEIRPAANPVGKSGSKALDQRKRISELNESHRNEIKALKSRYHAEHKLLQDAFKEHQRKAKDAIKEAGESSKKFYEGQLKQMRQDYASNINSLREELKQYLEKSVSEIARDHELRITKQEDEKFDNFRTAIHEDFLQAIQKKSEEIDLLRVQSNDEVARLVKENNEKNHRIAQLELKMKEISHYLPEDVHDEIYEQFGFEAELDDTEEKPKAKRRGLFARFTSIF